MIRILRILLFPISVLYGLVTAVRNILFANGIIESASFDIPVISIGNITVGGTGKTPHTEYVINLLKKKYTLAVLSRGYGRKTKGFIEVKEDSSPEQCGDEPCQMKQKFPSQLVVVDENRKEGIDRIKDTNNTDVILLDDAYQHRRVKPGLSILLVDYNRPVFKDFIMPTGNLREFPAGSQRADIIIVSKCPTEISDKEKSFFLQKLNIKTNQKLFFSTIVYDEAIAIFSKSKTIKLQNTEVLLLTGIANPKPLKIHLEQNGATVSCITFPDHHQFTERDIADITQRFEQLDDKNRCIVTTEKDTMRLKNIANIPEVIKKNLFYIPVKVKILDNENHLHQIIESYVKENRRSR